MSATRCTCVWSARPLIRLVGDPTCPAVALHVLTDTDGHARDRIVEP